MGVLSARAWARDCGAERWKWGQARWILEMGGMSGGCGYCADREMTSFCLEDKG